ncbi:TfoX/Sxy family protein [Dactylosporangium sp. CA-139114]|uniref:TfoX/Sxy family protein n=1 Tax=Dactylosporangium sp. CA-139114 TaxID=3239931 RepID=UPI003D9805B8
MAYDEVLAERLRERLPAAARRRLFGGPAVLARGNVTAGVNRDDLLVRLSPEDAAAALERPGVRPFDVTGRPMRGWVLVAGEHLDDADLDQWVATASAFVATLPPQ